MTWVLAGTCATVKLEVDPIVPTGVDLIDGRIPETSQYQRTDSRWRLVAHALF